MESTSLHIVSAVLFVAALLRRGFNDESIGAGGLFLGALASTLVAAAAFLLF